MAAGRQRRRSFFSLKGRRRLPKWVVWLIFILMKALSWTYRTRLEDEVGWVAGDGPWPAVVALWHNRMLFAPILFPKSCISRCSVLISASRDGEYISSFAALCGLDVVRGSSSRHGVQALLGLDSIIKAGRSAILTVDGPRGPKYGVHSGTPFLARKNGVPVVPVSINAQSYWQAKSWDNTQIPKPFSKVVLKVGRPFALEDSDSMEESCRKVHDKLMELTED